MKVNENLIKISGRPALTRGFNPLEFAAHVCIGSTIPKIVQAANSLKFLFDAKQIFKTLKKTSS